MERYSSRLVIERFGYLGFHDCDCACRLTIFKDVGRTRLTVVVATERQDNPGTSITNAAEYLATAVCREFSIDPDKLLWIEHYPPDLFGGVEWDLVTFGTRAIVCTEPNVTHLGDPTWRAMTAHHWGVIGLTPFDVLRE